MKTDEQLLTEFFSEIEDLLQDSDVLNMADFISHGKTDCLSHCLAVAYTSFVKCRKKKLDSRAAARGALLHDFYLYDHTDPVEMKKRGGRHVRAHARVALINADEHFELTNKERDIIAKHMWPVNPSRPLFHESLVVNYVDTYRAILEFIRLDKLSGVMLSSALDFVKHADARKARIKARAEAEAAAAAAANARKTEAEAEILGDAIFETVDAQPTADGSDAAQAQGEQPLETATNGDEQPLETATATNGDEQPLASVVAESPISETAETPLTEFELPEVEIAEIAEQPNAFDIGNEEAQSAAKGDLVLSPLPPPETEVQPDSEQSTETVNADAHEERARSERKPLDRFNRDNRTRYGRERKPFDRAETKPDTERKPFERTERKPFERTETKPDAERKPFERTERKPFDRAETKPDTERKPFDRTERKPVDRAETKPDTERKPFDRTERKPVDRTETKPDTERKPFDRPERK